MTDQQDMRGQELEQAEKEWALLKWKQRQDADDEAFRLQGALFNIEQLWFWHKALPTKRYLQCLLDLSLAYRPVSQRVQHCDNHNHELLCALLVRCYKIFNTKRYMY